MADLEGKIVRNINTPNVCCLIKYIRVFEETGMFEGKVEWIPLDEGVNLEEVKVVDKDFIISREQFFREFELLENPDTMVSLKDAKWCKMEYISNE